MSSPRRRQRVYVSGPLSSSGDRLENVRRAMDAGRALIQAGFAPLVPHLTHFMDETDALGHGIWLDVDVAWVAVSEALVRLPGESRGADREMHLAIDLGIPVYPSVADLIANPPPMEAGDLRFQALLQKLWRLHQKKAQDYGTGEDIFQNCKAAREFGVPASVGVMIRMNDKMQRLKSFAQKGSLANESVRDSLLDLAAYALIDHILLDEEGKS